MFPRTFHTRRLACRAVFMVACLVPTTALVVYGAWRATPFHHSAIRQALADALAVRVTIAQVEHPRPGVTRIEGLELADPESDQRLLRIDLLEVRQSGNRYVLSAAKATLDTTRAARLYEELHRRLAAGDDAVSWQVEIDEFTLLGKQSSPTQVELTAHGSMGSSGPVVEARFRLVGDVGQQASKIELVRNRQVTPAVTTFMLQTGDTPLPCSLIGQFAPQWDALGSDATFDGRFWTIPSDDGRRGELSGVLNHVDLNQLVTRTFGHPLTGMSRLQIHRAVMQQGRIRVAEVTINAGPGTVSQQLLQAGSREFQMPLFEGGRARTDALVAYQRLTAHVVIDGQGIRIQGHPPMRAAAPVDRNLQTQQAVGVILADLHGNILVEPLNRLPVTAVLRTLAAGEGDGALVHGPVGDLAKWLPQPLPPSRAEGPQAQTLNRTSRN